VNGTPYDQMRTTIRIVGKAIKDGAEYLPIRNLAARLATKAGPKDYLGQLESIYNYAIDNWRYVRDPAHKELVTTSPSALYRLVLAGDGKGLGSGRGAGDCDDITAGMGAMLYSIGFPVQMATTAPPNTLAGKMFGHIFIQAKVPKIGWITVDPVVHPNATFGTTPKHSRIAFFNLDGRLIGYRGNAVGLHGLKEGINMNLHGEDPGYATSALPDLGLGGIDTATPTDLPEDWRLYGIPDFGAYSEFLGIISGDQIRPLAAEVDYFLGDDGELVAHTPILELSQDDWQYVRTFGAPYDEMFALGDDGEVYYFDGTLGFFRRLARRIKKRVKKVARRIRRGIRRVIKKIPGGKKLIRLGKKIWKVAHKIVKPLIKFVGKYAAKLAPVAALIPGYGPAIAGALYSAGKIAKLMDKYAVKITGPIGKVRKLKFKSAKLASKFQRALKSAAEKEKRKVRRKPTVKRRLRRFSRRRAAPFRKISRRRAAPFRLRKARRSRWGARRWM
jgi:hypothetical protein